MHYQHSKGVTASPLLTTEAGKAAFCCRVSGTKFDSDGQWREK